MARVVDTTFKDVFAKLREIGFLLESDPKLPSVCSLVAGEAMRGSWWGHPRAHEIFQVNEALSDHEDVLLTKLVSGKVTFVHRKLWPHVIEIGRSRERWQQTGLSVAAKALPRRIDSEGILRTDQLNLVNLRARLKPGDAARELEKLLLIVATQIHTEVGAHAKLLESWDHWVQRLGYKPRRIALAQAKLKLEETLDEINQRHDANASFPWQH